MNEITEELLAEFKERMKLGDDEDSNLTRFLKESIEDLIDKCGEYDVHTNERFKGLVFNRSRYEYNDFGEYFDEKFQTQITTLAVSKALSTQIVEGTSDATN
ncbi:MAG: hypothetical protein RR595_09735 [Lysinibacillus sp.]